VLMEVVHFLEKISQRSTDLQPMQHDGSPNLLSKLVSVNVF